MLQRGQHCALITSKTLRCTLWLCMVTFARRHHLWSTGAVYALFLGYMLTGAKCPFINTAVLHKKNNRLSKWVCLQRSRSAVEMVAETFGNGSSVQSLRANCDRTPMPVLRWEFYHSFFARCHTSPECKSVVMSHLNNHGISMVKKVWVIQTCLNMLNRAIANVCELFLHADPYIGAKHCLLLCRPTSL